MTDSADRGSYRRIWALAWPTLLYSVLELSLGVADFLMVRGLGSEATAAIGLNRQITFLLESAALAVATGVIALVSQGVGAGNRAQVDGTVRQSLRLVVLLGVPTTLVGYLASRPLLVLLQANPETLAHGVSYLHIYFLGTLFLWASLVAAAVFRGTGDTLTPLRLAAAVSVLNIGLNYVFVFGAGAVPAYGVAGAAIGTVAARGVGAAIYLVLLVRGTPHARLRLRPWGGIDWELIRRILRIGTSPALAAIARNGARVVYLALLGLVPLGATLHAAVGVGLQVRLISVLPALAFQVAASTLVGQAVGAGRYDLAQSLGQRTVLLLALIMAGVVAVTFLLAEPIAALFIVDPEVATVGATVLRWFAVAQFFSSLSIGTQGALTGAGDTKPIFRYTVVTQWGVLLVLTVLLLLVVGWSPEGALLAWAVAPVLQLVLMQRLFRSGRWRTLRV
jgi:putative MATE family efflux protein